MIFGADGQRQELEGEFKFLYVARMNFVLNTVPLV
jgi:hypothetical protein